jgi:inorganic phosphate transporter, PiT family
MLEIVLVLVIIFAYIFEFINGFHDTANAIATTVYTKALSPSHAIMLAACMNFLGALVSERVAGTISKNLVTVQLEQYVILAALIGAIIWDLLTWWKGIPSSSSHALIGSLLGATVVYTSTWDSINVDGVVQKIIIPLFASPIVGLIFCFLLMSAIYRLCAHWSQRKVNKVFLRLQVFSAALVAYSHGNNDAQKTMGIITLALISSGALTADAGVPLWVKITCASTMALGTSIGGWKIMKTMGTKVTKLQPASGFAAETSAAIVIEGASFIGAPISTTQVITAAVMGAGSAKRTSAVKWGVAGNIVKAWLLTLPVSMVLGGTACWVIGFFI